MIQYFVLICLIKFTLCLNECPFGYVPNSAYNSKKDDNSTACLPFNCEKNEDCSNKFGGSTTCLPGGICGCSTVTNVVIEKTQRCGNKTFACNIGHCPDGSTCVKGNCFCNVGYFAFEKNEQLNCLFKNCSSNPDICSTMFGDNIQCKESRCQCSTLHYYDFNTHKCVHQMNFGIALGVAGAFLMITIGPMIFFSIIS